VSVSAERELTNNELLLAINTRFDKVDRRVDAIELVQTQRHLQNSERLDRINGKVDKAHARASKLEAWFHTMQSEVEKLRLRYHEIMNKAQEAIAKPLIDLKDRPVTMVEARWLIGVLIAALTGGALFTVWILKLTGKL
jgi:predicted nuclease with TOPRIM domain